ncbi:solute carrier organic anion transporter family member 2A1, partial [Aplysia californica]|uniref:Solute carrier organic anion transporter family member n=1 Tax=Aplysia californica TaxID=6500 RepID=A0ABM0ZYB4_APLCA
MMLQGFAKAPRSSFTVTYVDDNTEKVNTGMHVGIITTMGIFGPAIAYLMGGVFSKIYVTLEETSIHPKHPRWIGAWWLGYIVFGSMALVIAMPLFFFPRTLNRAPTRNNRQPDNAMDSKPEEKTKQHLKPDVLTSGHTKQQTVPSTLVKPKSRWALDKFFTYIRGFFQALLRLLTNPLYLLMTTSTCFVIFMVSGTSAYSPKYLERMFHLPAYQANYIMAGKTLSAACIGTFAGGYLTKRMKLTPLKGLKFIIFVLIMSLLTSLAGFWFKCDQPEVHLGPGSDSDDVSCGGQCHCKDDSYFPICGDDGKTYYSPCFAGCLQGAEGIYTNCTCIPGGGAVSGTCDYSCSHLAPYAVFSAFRSLFGTLSIIPKLIVFIRCVADKDKSLAIGSSSFMASLMGWLLGPIIFGNVIDGICTIWDVQCGTRGRCLLYDNNLFRLKLHGYSSVAIGCSLICNLLAFLYAKKTGKLDNVGLQGVTDEEDPKTEMTLVVPDDFPPLDADGQEKGHVNYGSDVEDREED